MGPKRRDWLGAGLMALFLVALVVVLVAIAWASGGTAAQPPALL